MFFSSAHDHRLDYFPLLYLAVGRSFFHRGGNYVAKSCAQSGTASQRENHLQLAGAGIVGNLEHGSHHDAHKYSPGLETSNWQLAFSTWASNLAIAQALKGQM